MILYQKQLLPFQNQKIERFIKEKSRYIREHSKAFTNAREEDIDNYIRTRLTWATNKNLYLFSTISFLIDLELSFGFWQDLSRDTRFNAIINNRESDEANKVIQIRKLIVEHYFKM